MSSIELPEVAQLHGLGARDLEQVLRELDVARRQVEFLIAETVGEAERSRAFREDGHRSVFAWARAVCNWSAGTTTLAVQTSRLLQACDQVRDAATDARLGVDQLRVLAGLYANPRSRDQFADSAALLVDDAHHLWFDELLVVAQRWQALADQDGAHQANERAYAGRDARLSIVGEQVWVDAHGGVPAGAEMVEIFERFGDAEFAADWQAGLDTYGEQMCAARLARTARQRRFDALLSIFRAAATSGVVGRIQPTVNVVVDLDSFEHHLGQACAVDTEALDPASVHSRRCETIDGHQLDPADVVAAAMIGHVRRVVLDSSGVVIDLGRKRRLFTGAGRDAVVLGDRWCLWPGCDLRSGRCQTDHSQPWSDGGPTASRNGGLECGHHNRFKQRGYKTWRDPTGQWHIVRPDGTEIGYFGAGAEQLSSTGS